MFHQISMLMFIVALGASPLAAAESFQAGAATSSNITPEIGRRVIGGFVPYPSKNIHDELHARCLVLDDGTTRLAIVVCDLLGIDRVVSDKARALIAERYDVPREHVLISATHTHSASSALGGESRKLNQQADEYQLFVAERIADGVARAINNLRPAELGFGVVDVPEHLFNRRWHMRPGTVPVNPFGEIDTVKMNPPSGNDNLVKPAGPIDPAVSFFAIRRPDGKPIAVYAAYSLHYVGGTQRGDVSADYFAVFSEHLKHLMSSGPQVYDDAPFVAMMANATSGDINNINFKNRRDRKSPYEQMHYVGTDVAEKVHGALPSVTYRDDIQLAAAYREPTITLRRPTPDQLAWAKRTISAGQKVEKDLPFIYAKRTMLLAEYPETATVPLHVMRIGDVCLGTMPFEVFCEIGLDFKARSPIQPAFMVELAHGYFGYLPTPRQHRLGGYETWLGTNRVEIEASDKLLDELLDMATELKNN